MFLCSHTTVLTSPLVSILNNNPGALGPFSLLHVPLEPKFWSKGVLMRVKVGNGTTHIYHRKRDKKLCSLDATLTSTTSYLQIKNATDSNNSVWHAMSHEREHNIQYHCQIVLFQTKIQIIDSATSISIFQRNTNYLFICLK
ncbi:hypothetical protein VNO77_19850 [Canavalia gladiata]|uniref:Uncharacterized protein n=1 Tax=Canavalia gladiata TaxID=3824 RepID=A0AAN9QKW1_CANGL